ncbi:hypothetical protein P9578_03785 [Brevibacillus choshinensis]|uniref:hypothetical protein n=1 Tax=Brevibacillus choshinensis TaxID=54911 RepID=UPI002E1D159A|nr:hypothetical protein [Brevibacillus choshinensis]
MILDQIITFFQEWWVPITTLLVIGLTMAADLFPEFKAFMKEIEQRYPQGIHFLHGREQYVNDCYERLPVRIRAGFAIIGGKQAWAWLVKSGYAYLRRKK